MIVTPGEILQDRGEPSPSILMELIHSALKFMAIWEEVRARNFGTLQLQTVRLRTIRNTLCFLNWRYNLMYVEMEIRIFL